MFNFLFSKEATFFSTLFTLILYVSIVIYFLPVLTKDRNLSKSQRRIGKFLILLFFLFPMWGGDVYSYYKFITIESPNYNGGIDLLAQDVSVEKVYLYIAHFLGYDYLFWRLVVFGGMFFIGLKVGKRLNLNQDKYLACFALFSMVWLSYARASLAMAIGFLGMTYLVKPILSKENISYIFGLMLLGISLLFHKSAVIIPVVVLLSLIRFNRWSLFLLLLSFPIVVTYFQNNASDFIMDMSDEGTMLNVKSAQGYLTRERAVDGFAMATMDHIKRTWLYAVPIVCLFSIWQKRYQKLHIYIQKFINVDIIIIVFASLFLFLNESVRLTLLHRFMYFSLIPVSVVMSSFFEKHFYFNACKLLLYLCVFSNFLYMFYSVYLAR